MRALQDQLAHLEAHGVSQNPLERAKFVFRVQLSSTQDYDRAMEAVEVASEQFSEDVVLQFDSPYYKIRVGRLINREDAQLLQETAIQKGYRRAWVVRTENTEGLQDE